jgi:DNA-binding SARP family transcriptional activator
VRALEAAPVATLVAGGGYGKTVLATEYARMLGVGCAVVRLEPGDDEPSVLVARLRRALRRSGLSDGADALQAAQADAAAAVDRLLDLLAAPGDPVLLVLDEVEHAGGASGRLLSRLAQELPDGHRLLLVGRRLPDGATRLGAEPGIRQLGPRELAFTADEASALLERFGLATEGLWVERLLSLAAGWPMALILAAERLALATDLEEELDRLARSPALVAGLVEEHLRSLPAGVEAAVVQLAHLPILSTNVAERATGVAGLLDLLAAAGMPFETGVDGRVQLPDPVREALVSRGALGREQARRAAAVYVDEGLLADAVRVLVAAGDDEAAAATVAALAPRVAGRLDFGELRALLGAITREAVDGHPRALLHLARACEAAAEARVRSEALERAARNAHDDAVLAREIDAEVARDLIRDGQVDEAAAVAERLLATAGADELQTRVRALHVLGRTHAWRGDASSLAAAEPLLEEAAALYGRLGYATARAHALLALAYDVYTLGGRFDDAVQSLGLALDALPGRSRLRGIVLVFHAEALVDLGRFAEAEASLAEAERLGILFGDARTLGYTAWVRARPAASQGEAARVRELLAEAERHRGEWFEHHSGAEFLAEAAVLLDQVGERELADAYLDRAVARQDEAPRYVRLAMGALAARSGDAREAEAVLAAVGGLDDLEARERWRVALLRAWAAHRAGDAERAATLAREAFELAGATGAPDLPLRREPAIAGALLSQAAAAGSAAAAGLLPAGPPVSVSVLEGFAVRRGADPVALPPGRPTSLVKLVAVRNGRIATEEAIEALWPGVDAASGRKRLRNVLNRLRESAGDLVARDGESLALAASVEVDAVLFETAALGAIGGGGGVAAADRARAALALYAGDLLPEDRYEDWAAEPRERLRARALALLDLLVDEAEREGEIDEALRLLERAITADRLDESRYLRAAALLLRQGKRGRALDLLRAAAGALRELDLEPSNEHRTLVRAARV